MDMGRPYPQVGRARAWGQVTLLTAVLFFATLALFAIHPMLAVAVLCTALAIMILKFDWLKRRVDRIETINDGRRRP